MAERSNQPENHPGIAETHVKHFEGQGSEGLSQALRISYYQWRRAKGAKGGAVSKLILKHKCIMKHHACVQGNGTASLARLRGAWRP